jgi:hypothetical protein
MLKPLIQSCVLLTAMLFVAQTFAQAQDNPTPEQQQMQQMRSQIFINMQQRGIDPQEFFGQIRQQIQDGTLDPADIQKVMVEKGIMDQQMVTQMQTTFQSSAYNRIREQLNCSDDEWKVILPKLQKVMSASADASQTGQGGGIATFMGMQITTAASKARRELRAAVQDPSTPSDVLAYKLRAWRDAHEKAKTAYVDAQKDLIDLLTPRQEAILMTIGIIQ